MSSNQSLVRKADLTLADLSSDGGLLNPEQSNTFIRTLIETPTLLQSVRTVAMNSPEMKINKIGFGSRIMRPAVSGSPLSSGDRVKPDLSQVVLNTKEIMATVYLPYDVLEDNIEGGNIAVPLQGQPGGIHNTIVTLLAQRAALDIEAQGLLGDTASGDAYLAMQDGWLKLLTANVVDNGLAGFSKDTVKAGIRTMPPKYLSNRASLINFVSVNNETELRDQYGTRQTAMGDANVQGNLPLYVFGSKVTGVAQMPEQSGIYTNPQNLIFGVQRQITLEYDKDIESRVFIVVLTCRVDYQIEETNAAVKYTNVV